MGLFSEAAKRSGQIQQSNGDDRQSSDPVSPVSRKSSYFWVFGLALVALIVLNIFLVSSLNAVAKEKDKRLARVLDNVYQEAQALEAVREQIVEASKEISEFRMTLDLSSRKLKEANSRMSSIEMHLDGLEFQLHNVIKAKDHLYSLVTKLDSESEAVIFQKDQQGR